MGRLEGRTALVTGAAGGIGAATAHVLAREGAQLVLVDVDEPGLVRLHAALEEDGVPGAGLLAHVADVSSEAAVAACVAAAVERFGRIDVLCNLAAILGPLDPLTELDEAAFDRTMAVNAKGVWLTTKHVAPHMVAAGDGGSVVNANANLTLGAIPRFGGYLASQHAVVGLTQVAAIELAEHAIRVNAVMIGPTDAPISHQVIAELLPDMVDSPPPPPLPLGRRATPCEIAEVIAFLASGDASFMTGACVPVDGGYSAR